jgi:hypothetical protein
MGFKLRVKGLRFRVFVRMHETTFKLALKVSALPFALAAISSALLSHSSYPFAVFNLPTSRK